MKLSTTIILGLASYAAAAAVFTDAASEAGVEKRTNSKDEKGVQKSSGLSRDSENSSHENSSQGNSGQESSGVSGKADHSYNKQQSGQWEQNPPLNALNSLEPSMPTVPFWPTWPKFGNCTTTTSSVKKPTSSTRASPVTKTSSEVKTRSTKSVSPTTTHIPLPTKTASPTTTSPEAISSWVASEISKLLGDMFTDCQTFANFIDEDFTSIFSQNGFSLFKRNLETTVEARGNVTDEEVEAALSTLVTNVFSHLVALTNGTNVSLTLSVFAALNL
ncbi:hypothetical protein METBIDRAFT_153548 [Metschnikowia bicuspidata var. bicuspidata NRRL YB-4993]|uniref:Uncharacterized protein n=1 Tax=Metschnikowia bicuspidata var. bicuspidata NRRL YB-4993 TaxID=869754 RepID=A0A1A0HEL3_9ASCO|nr:hypothetical protein METBIDRAFT_153548 [Metschnikowia bicuspidata var. bicuspidata NRRL YB-4993]OBA22441.1 hypothetical protein METBIDRAFT_153548 [Metschnikowia bicuspidata var. bicuspidata NRRL YB-4993]